MNNNTRRHLSRCLVQRKFLIRVLRQLIDEGDCYGGYAFRDVLGPAVCDCAHCKAVRLLKKADELDAAGTDPSADAFWKDRLRPNP